MPFHMGGLWDHHQGRPWGQRDSGTRGKGWRDRDRRAQHEQRRGGQVGSGGGPAEAPVGGGPSCPCRDCQEAPRPSAPTVLRLPPAPRSASWKRRALGRLRWGWRAAFNPGIWAASRFSPRALHASPTAPTKGAGVGESPGWASPGKAGCDSSQGLALRGGMRRAACPRPGGTHSSCHSGRVRGPEWGWASWPRGAPGWPRLARTWPQGAL